MTALRRVLSTLTVAAMGLVALVVLTGQLVVVATHGTSMQPTYTANDLVLIRAEAAYGVGDVVAYRSATLDVTVLHRVVQIDGDRLVTQGDNNDFLDPDRPTTGEVMGTARASIPQVGWVLRLPLAVRAAAITALAALALAGARRPRSRRARRPSTSGPGIQLLPEARRRRSTRRPRRTRTSVAPRGVPAWVGWPAKTALVAGPLAVLALALALIAFTRPSTGPGEVDYTHRGEFAYTSPAPAGLVYPDGHVSTGDPVFLRLVDTLDVTFTYQLDAPAGDVTAVGQLMVEIADGSGWSRSSPLGDEQTSAGEPLTLAGTLEIGQLRRTLERVQQQTGIGGGNATITVTAQVDATGHVPITDEFAPAVRFQLDEYRLVPQVDEDHGFTVSQQGATTVADAAPARLELGGWGVPVPAARALSVAVILAALTALAIATVGAARRRDLDEAARLDARYGHRLVEVAALRAPAGHGLVDVRDLATLVALADRAERPVFHHRLGAQHTYLVEGDTTHYRFRIDAHPDAPEPGVPPEKPVPTVPPEGPPRADATCVPGHLEATLAGGGTGLHR